MGAQYTAKKYRAHFEKRLLGVSRGQTRGVKQGPVPEQGSHCSWKLMSGE